MIRPLRGSRIAYSTGSPANARPRTSNAPPGSPSSANRPFFVPTRSSVIRSSPSRYGRQDVDAVVLGDRRPRVRPLAADKDVDVPADRPALVEDPTAHRRLRALELAQQLADGRARDAMGRAAAGERAKRAAQGDEGHGSDPRVAHAARAYAGSAWRRSIASAPSAASRAARCSGWSTVSATAMATSTSPAPIRQA